MNKYTSFARIAPLLLFCVLAVFVLYTIFSGAGLYQSVNERESDSRTMRTAAQYLTVRLSQSGETDPAAADYGLGETRIAVEDFGGVDALALSEEIGGIAFVTRIYCHDGYLRELFCMADSEMLPSDGEKLLPLDGFVPVEEEGLLSLTLSLDGEETTLFYDIDGEDTK